MNYKILETVLTLSDKEEKQKIMIDYIEHILFKNWFQQTFFKMNPESYKIAEDVIFLKRNNNQNEIKKISTQKFISNTIQKEIDACKENNSINNIHIINGIIETYEKYIEITFTLKNIDVLIRSERRQNIVQVVLVIFTAICAIIGAIIGGILGNSDWIKALF